MNLKLETGDIELNNSFRKAFKKTYISKKDSANVKYGQAEKLENYKNLYNKIESIN